MGNRIRRAKIFQGLPMKSISRVMTALTILLIAVSLWSIVAVVNSYKALQEATNIYIESQKDLNTLSAASDNLTEQVRMYVLTEDPSFLWNYCDEDASRHREKAIKSLERSLGGSYTEVLGDLNDALNNSVDLQRSEWHALKLVAVSSATPLEVFPTRIQEEPLTTEELSMSEAERAEVAYQLVFGREYRGQKDAIEKKAKVATELLSFGIQTTQQEQTRETGLALVRLFVCVLLFMAITGMNGVVMRIALLNPLKQQIAQIEHREPFQDVGCAEIRQFAAAYNDLAKQIHQRENDLQFKMEHDALTGLYNRHAFDTLRDVLRTSPTPMALVLIDVDYFKDVNDTFGHEEGDEALVRIANLIKQFFRSADFPIRLGGDEFAVLMLDVGWNERMMMERKFQSMNEILRKAEPGKPSLSLSIGIAMSDSGYSDELYVRADKALYMTKDRGRNGYTFYED